MGNWWSAPKVYKIILTGLVGSGKTTFCYKMNLAVPVPTIGTIGFNVDSFKYKNFEFVCWDMANYSSKQLWKHYISNTDFIIFFVDSAFDEDISESKSKLQDLLSEESLQGVPLIVFANKQDLPAANNIQEITNKLELECLTGREWFIQGTCATTGDGLYEGLDLIFTILR